MSDSKRNLFVRLTPENRKWLGNKASESALSLTGFINVMITKARKKDERAGKSDS